MRTYGKPPILNCTRAWRTNFNRNNLNISRRTIEVTSPLLGLAAEVGDCIITIIEGIDDMRVAFQLDRV